jgi:3-oxoacyl-[acyl-carrier-protein] synthase-1
MTTSNNIYIAGIGMVTAVGGNANMTAAAINAGMSGYQASEFISTTGKPITMATVPDEVFDDLNFNLTRHHKFYSQHGHIIKMAILAMQDAYVNSCASSEQKSPMPLLLAMPESRIGVEQMPAEIFIENIIDFSDLPIDPNKVHRIYSGRSAGLELLALAQRYLFEQNEEFVLMGGSDSPLDNDLLGQLEVEGRLLFEHQTDAFAPGEAASFILLTKNPEFAKKINEQFISLYPVGLGKEPGHLTSDLPYKGEGLDLAFKSALVSHQQNDISTIYSSMNGENFWAKEFGVAQLRNKKSFTEQVNINHPADCIGDVGAAMGTTLLGLSAMNLLNQAQQNNASGKSSSKSSSKPASHLIYSSSDGEKRAAVVIKKMTMANLQPIKES